MGTRKEYVYAVAITDEQATALIVAVDGYLDALQKQLGHDGHEVRNAAPGSCVARCLEMQAVLRDCQHGRANTVGVLAYPTSPRFAAMFPRFDVPFTG